MADKRPEQNNFRSRTPHAAVIIWNYKDRIDSSSYHDVHAVEPMIVSTASCISIQTSKSKNNPAGTFAISLAPTRNWVSSIVAGSWVAILMSNTPITKDDLVKANPRQLKMIGIIDTVRVDTKISENGARMTTYNISGSDWGQIFLNSYYIDPLILNEINRDLTGLADPLAGSFFQTLLDNAVGEDGPARMFGVTGNISRIMKYFGSLETGREGQKGDMNRLPKPVYNIYLPSVVAKFLSLTKKTASGLNIPCSSITEGLNDIQCGILKNKPGTAEKYSNEESSLGFLNPFGMQGTYTIWQLMVENCNNVINELVADMRFDKKGKVGFSVFNRIKPFSYKTVNSGNQYKSNFNSLNCNKIDSVRVVSVNAGSNWRDKFNFVEVKPIIPPDWTTYDEQDWKRYAQQRDESSFEREGLRPMIVETRQLPIPDSSDPDTNSYSFNYKLLASWVTMMREWYFGTHKMLNGRITIMGGDEYISIGENILFDALLINPTANISSEQLHKKSNSGVLAHVENISHSFSVNPTGARTYSVVIEFVRGILVNNSTLEPIGDGALDANVDALSPSERLNKHVSVSREDGKITPEE